MFYFDDDRSVIANSVIPYEMRHFIWVYTVRQRMHLGVTKQFLRRLVKNLFWSHSVRFLTNYNLKIF